MNAAVKQALAAPASAGPSVAMLGSAATPSPAESFALNGALAYVCDDNEVSVIDISNPSNPKLVATALSGLIQKSGNIHCSVQRGVLSVFADQVSTTVGNSPGYSAFSLVNPLQPQLIAATPVNKRFFQEPVYIGNVAFVPTSALTFFLGFQWDSQEGDLIAVDLTNFSNPVLTGTLEQPQVSAQFGAQTVVLGGTQADAGLIYLGGSTSTGGQNNGSGRMQVADVSNPAGMKLVGQLMIPGTVHFMAPLLQGTVGVGIGNTGGFVGSLTANPGTKGNIVVTTFDVSDRRAPAILSTTLTNYTVGAGAGATRIGALLFAFAGVLDPAGNPVLLIVDANNPRAPIVQSIPIAQPFTSMQASGATLYGTLGGGGFAAYSIPGINTGPALTCPASLDAVVVVDRTVHLQGQAALDEKAALKSFIDALHLPADQIGVVTFAGSATLAQPLTTNGVLAKSILDSTVAGAGASFLGAGIAAAQGELSGPRRQGSATPLIILLSNGADGAAPNGTATIAAANAAKAAGIRIITLQLGLPTNTLMQSIASSGPDYYVVGQ